jgi:hypothetical protein
MDNGQSSTRLSKLQGSLHLISSALLIAFFCDTKILHRHSVKKRTVRIMVFNITFNNISVISWQSVLLVEETGVPGENHRPAASHWQTLLHNIASSNSQQSLQLKKYISKIVFTFIDDSFSEWESNSQQTLQSK